MRRYKSFVSLSLICLTFGCGAILVSYASFSRGRHQPGAQAEATDSNPFGSIDNKIRALKGGEEAAARAMAEEVFSSFDLNSIPAGMADALKDRLVRAEVNYRKGRGNAVSELSIAHMVNRLASRLNAPAYFRTNLYEVKRLEAGIMLFSPQLRAQLRERQSLARNAPVERTLSPLEATFIAGLLIQQKRYNPEYQLTNDEWITLHGGSRRTEWSRAFNLEMRARANDSGRRNEISAAMEKGFRGLSPAQMLRLPSELLDVLRVERNEKEEN
jgi:hypothetical protein